MGSRGTMVVEKEKSLMLYYEKEPGAKGGARTSHGGDVSAPAAASRSLDASSTGAAPSRRQSDGWAGRHGRRRRSRGYREEMEDFAYCVRLWDAKLGYKKDEPASTCSACRAATARWRWPTPSSP